MRNNISEAQQNQLQIRDQKIDRWLLHPVFGPIGFLLSMFVLFQSIFSWAKPISTALQSWVGVLQDLIKQQLSYELIASLLSDGILAGVGAVIAFVPQIAILFLLIGFLEYTGYLPRVAYMVDRLLKPYGLDGKVFIPLLSSIACAVPGILATRTIESERRRIVTIMISPLMTCSARLPVYTLLISTFIPNTTVGFLSLPGLVMFGMYLTGVCMALAVALVLHWLGGAHRSYLVDMIHLPHYRSPNWSELLRFVWSRVWMFLQKAGTVIAAMAILLWVLLSFPRNSEGWEKANQKKQEILASAVSQQVFQEKIETVNSELASQRLVNSYGGRLGHLLEPIFEPIGYDWRLTIGILASLAAREVFVSTIATVFALSNGEDKAASLPTILLAQKKPNGQSSYTVATCLSLLVFFAFSLQCISTVAVARRETNSWKIPAVMFSYMFVLAYGGAFVIFHLANWVLAL